MYDKFPLSSILVLNIDLINLIKYYTWWLTPTNFAILHEQLIKLLPLTYS